MTVNDLKALVVRDWELNDRRSAKSSLTHWRATIRKMGNLAVEAVTTEKIEDFKSWRLKEGVERQTVNNELSVLRRGFNLAIEQELILKKPRIRLLAVSNARSGFIEPTEFQRITNTLDVLDRDASDLVRFLYLVGWRIGEARGLVWSEVNVDEGTMQLPARRSKNRSQRSIRLGKELHALLRRRWEIRRGEHVFHRNGRPVKDFRRRWERAVTAIGRPELVPHDCRRSFCRNAVIAGVPQKVIMEIGGWKTTAVFLRYCITDETQIQQALDLVGDISLSKRTKSA